MSVGTRGSRHVRAVAGLRSQTLLVGAIPTLAAAAAICFLAWPMLFTSAGMAQDWANHLWYLWRASVAVGRDHAPSLFLPYGAAAFFPLYAFYGGTLYMLGGAIAALDGHPIATYVASYVAGFAAAYAGWYWLGRLAGLGRWSRHLPPLLFVTSAYYLTLVYARGDWPEFMGVSMLPLLAASALSVFLDGRLRALPALALSLSTLVLFGSHAITMLWGTAFFIAAGVLLLLFVPNARRLITRGGVSRVALIAVPSALVNSWFLVPALAYEGRTAIAKHYDYAQSLRGSSFLVSFGNLFTLSRASTVANTPDFVLALPLAAVGFMLVAVVASGWRSDRSGWRTALWVAAALGAGITVLMTHPGLILDLPHPFTLLQFSYRLETYVLLAIVAGVLCALVLASRSGRRIRAAAMLGALVTVLASIVGAVQQVDGYPQASGSPGVVVPNRDFVFAADGAPPVTAGGLSDYDDATLPVVDPHTSLAVVFPADQIRDDHVTVPVTLSRGAQVHTNLAGAPYLVSVAGARVIGRDVNGLMVLEALGKSKISLRSSARLPVVLGRVTSTVAVAFLAVLFLGLVGARLRDRIGRRAGAPIG